jgi:protein-tyrosine phosphatase
MTVVSNQDMLARRLSLTGTTNVRDIGGYLTEDGRSVAWRRLLRGDALHRVDAEGRELLAGYQLRTAVDLREEDERQDAPDQLGAAVRLVPVPLFTYELPPGTANLDPRRFSSLEELYGYVVAERGPALAAALRELARPDALPAIVHCAGGKDRTGIVVALLLAALGVPDDVIAADYAATALFHDDEFRRVALQHAVDAGHDRAQFAALLGCEPRLILDVLDTVRSSHGDITAYLVHHGLRAAELEQLRSLLLEDGPAAPAQPVPNGGTGTKEYPHA